MVVPFHIHLQDRIAYAIASKYRKYFVDPFGVIFSYIKLGATEGHTSALLDSKQCSGRKLRKVKWEKLITAGGTAHSCSAVLEA